MIFHLSPPFGPFDTSVVVEVREGWMGAVIGKGGETVRKLQSEHGVSINSLPGRSAFHVSGEKPDDVDAAVAAIECIYSDGCSVCGDGGCGLYCRSGFESNKSTYQRIIAGALGVKQSKVVVQVALDDDKDNQTMLLVESNVRCASVDQMNSIVSKCEKPEFSEGLQTLLRKQGTLNVKVGTLSTTPREIDSTMMWSTVGVSTKGKSAKFDGGWVAKESKYLEGEYSNDISEQGRQNDADLDFHLKNLVTQAKAKALADHFSQMISQMNKTAGKFEEILPTAEYTACFLFKVETKDDSQTGRRPLFVEPRLNGKYKVSFFQATSECALLICTTARNGTAILGPWPSVTMKPSAAMKPSRNSETNSRRLFRTGHTKKRKERCWSATSKARFLRKTTSSSWWTR